jgi:hypothetical protein
VLVTFETVVVVVVVSFVVVVVEEVVVTVVTRGGAMDVGVGNDDGSANRASPSAVARAAVVVSEWTSNR